MTIDLIQLASIAGAIITVVSLAKLVVEPFNKVMKEIKTALSSLEKTIDNLTFDLRESQKDRENIHKVIDRHELRIGAVEDKTIVNEERIKTLFERSGK